MSPLARLIAVPVHSYRLLFSPWVGHSCRFQPSCSAYALDALEHHGAIRGTWLIIHRICRCNPWGGSGYDPVPALKSTERAGMKDKAQHVEQDLSRKD